MHLTISDKSKKDIFISLFQLLKSCSSAITIYFNNDHIYIQGMDKSHVCLFEIKIGSSWFNSYEVLEENISICLCTQFFYNILSLNEERHTIHLHCDSTEDLDLLSIDLIIKESKGEYNKYFKMPLCDMEDNILEINPGEYDAEFSISAKKISDIISQLTIFGNIMDIKCSEEKIELISNGGSGEMLVKIPIDDLSEFSISEGETINVAYSLNYIHKMCITTKLSNEINFFVSADKPLKIMYDLGENNFVHFFIAPKIND